MGVNAIEPDVMVGSSNQISNANQYQSSLFLGHLSPSARETLLARAGQLHFDAGETIFCRGDPGESLYLIETGRIEISVTSLGGRKSVLNYMRPGEVFGEIAMLDGGERSTDAVAGTDANLLSLARADVLEFLAREPEATMALISLLCEKVRNASDMFENQSQVTARMRLARCLLRIAEKWGVRQSLSEIWLSDGLSQSDLGDFSGLARENVNRNLKGFANEGVIRFEDSILVICDEEALSDIAEI